LGLLATSAVYANNKEQKRLENSGVVMQEIMNIPDNLPQDVMQKAECVIVFPSVLKAAFVVGASYGRGAMVCRTGKEFHGPWGSPAMEDFAIDFMVDRGAYAKTIKIEAARAE
jgi:lipid-binding SYLF domain-containing protein